MKKLIIMLSAILLICMLSSCNSFPVEDMEAQTDNKPPVQSEESITPVSIEDWSKEVISDKPGNTHIRYYVLDERGADETMLDVYNMTEEHDIDEDGCNEIIVYLQGEYLGIGIYDIVTGELTYIDVNVQLNCTASDYTGNIGNILHDYSNCIQAVFIDADGTQKIDIYRFSEGVFTYECPLDEALRK